jgi:hypothetical protein
MTDARKIQRTAGGMVVHVIVPGYRMGLKTRSVPDSSALCGANIWTNGAGPPVDVSPPLSDPCRWCPKCLGLEAERRGSLDVVVQVVGLS